MNNRGMGYVFQPTYVDKGVRKKAATWWISFSVRGRRIRQNADTTNRADAVRLLKKRNGEVGIGKAVGPEIDRTTLDDLLGMVEADYTANGRRSLSRAQFAAKNLRAFFGGTYKVRDITTDRVTAYQARRLEGEPCERCDGSGRIESSPCGKCGGAGKLIPAAASVNYDLAILRRGFRLGARAGKVGSRPEFALLHVDNARKGFFEREQFQAVLRHLPDEQLKAVATVAYITGWRTHSELLSRQWRHVDFAAGWLRLDPGESKNGEGREFPFTPGLRSVLEAQRERVRAIEKTTGAIIPWVFCRPLNCRGTEAGSRIKDFRTAWANGCRDAGVPGRLVHDFRRTAVRNLERAGVPRSAAMRMTGHKTESVYRRYAITDSAMLQEAGVKLAAFHAAEERRGKVQPKSGLGDAYYPQKPLDFIGAEGGT